MMGNIDKTETALVAVSILSKVVATVLGSGSQLDIASQSSHRR